MSLNLHAEAGWDWPRQPMFTNFTAEPSERVAITFKMDPCALDCDRERVETVVARCVGFYRLPKSSDPEDAPPLLTADLLRLKEGDGHAFA